MTRRNDEDRTQWVLNDEGLYRMAQQAGGVRKFVRQSRRLIDDVIDQVEQGQKRPHFLVYG